MRTEQAQRHGGEVERGLLVGDQAEHDDDERDKHGDVEERADGLLPDDSRSGGGRHVLSILGRPAGHDCDSHPHRERDEAAHEPDLVTGKVVAADDDRGEGGDNHPHRDRHQPADARDHPRVRGAAAPHGDERPEPDEHAGDRGQLHEQIGVLHVPPPPHTVMAVRMGAAWQAVERRTTLGRPVRVPRPDQRGSGA